MMMAIFTHCATKGQRGHYVARLGHADSHDSRLQPVSVVSASPLTLRAFGDTLLLILSMMLLALLLLLELCNRRRYGANLRTIGCAETVALLAATPARLLSRERR